MSILIKNVYLEGDVVDVFIEGNKFKSIGRDLKIKEEEVDEIIDGSGKAILPSFVNGHTHAAMILLRGYADDMELHTWLKEVIWPLEEKLSEYDVYVGTKLACLEMIKTGTTLFNDMYWHFKGIAKAVDEMGIRAVLSSVFIDFNNPELAKKNFEECKALYEEYSNFNERIIFALGPHAVYTVSKESLIKIKEFAEENNLLIHIHLSETKKEVQDCLKETGKTPAEYLDDIGLLGPNLCAAHCVWLTDKEVELFQEKGAKIIHNPISNLKLCSGIFPYKKIKEKNISICIGTDGCCSNNNLDMFEEIKVASLLGKISSQDPRAFSAKEVYLAATRVGYEIFGLNGGVISEGKLADCILVDLKDIHMIPCYNLISNVVYSANGSCVNTTICNGKILMKDRKVPREEEIIEEAREVMEKITSISQKRS